MSRPDDPAPLPYAGGLTPYAPGADAPWTPRRAAHLLRRTGFGAPPERVATLVAAEPRAAVARLVEAARTAPLPARPAWADADPAERGADTDASRAFRDLTRTGNRELDASVMEEALGARDPATPLREKLALAWHARIPVGQTRQASQAYAYWTILREHAFGSFREMIRAIGTTPTMLVYLDGRANRVGAPNENYARELLELFTMGAEDSNGRPNYTQHDVTDLARAFTGWALPQNERNARFRSSQFDDGAKTIFGVTGPFDADGAVDLIFRARAEAVSHHAAEHLYRSFVHGTPQPQVVGEMAERLRRDDFEMAGTVGALLGSQHFFAETTLGAQIKSPFEHVLGLGVDLGVEDHQPLYSAYRTRAAAAGFDRFQPVDVSGWPGGRAWLDTRRLTQRWLTSDALVGRSHRAGPLLQELPAPDDPASVVDAVAGRLFSVPLPEATRAAALDVLLGGIPPYEWSADADGAVARMRELMKHLARLPEYQLT